MVARVAAAMLAYFSLPRALALVTLVVAAAAVPGPALAQASGASTAVHEPPAAGASAGHGSVAETIEYRHTMVRASMLDRVAGSLGFGNLVGLGMPVLILAGGALRTLGISPPPPLDRYIHPESPLYSWPFMLLALLALALFVLSGNEKVTKGPKLLAQIAAIPPTLLLAVAVPIAAELTAPGTTTALLAQAGTGVPEGAAAASGLGVAGILAAVGLGLVAMLCTALLLLTRLLLSFLVWLSPFPFVDLLLNLLFHGYAFGLVVVTLVAPPVGLAIMVAQTVIALLVVRRLLRFARATWQMGAGAFLWHLARGRVPEQPDLPGWGALALDDGGALETPRVSGWVQRVPGAPKDAALVLGLKERGPLYVVRRGRGRHAVEVPLLELHEARVRWGALYDELELVHRQGTGTARTLVHHVVGLDKGQRKALSQLTGELVERGIEVHEHSRSGRRPRALPPASQTAAEIAAELS